VPQGERQAAEARLQEVTAAWAVLGDDQQRLVYDRGLTTSATTSTADDPFAHLVRRQRRIDDVAEGDRADLGEPLPGWVRVLPLAVLLGVLGAIFLFTAYAGGPDEPSAVQTQEELPVGTCVTLPVEGGIDEVECGTPSDGTVAAIVDWPEPCPVPLVAVPVPERRENLCLRD
jgi:hypothetical protein